MIEAFEAAKRAMDDDYFLETNSDILTREPTRKEVKGWIRAYKKDERIFKKKARVFIDYFFGLWD